MIRTRQMEPTPPERPRGGYDPTKTSTVYRVRVRGWLEYLVNDDDMSVAAQSALLAAQDPTRYPPSKLLEDDEHVVEVIQRAQLADENEADPEGELIYTTPEIQGQSRNGLPEAEYLDYTPERSDDYTPERSDDDDEPEDDDDDDDDDLYYTDEDEDEDEDERDTLYTASELQPFGRIVVSSLAASGAELDPGFISERLEATVFPDLPDLPTSSLLAFGRRAPEPAPFDLSDDPDTWNADRLDA